METDSRSYPTIQADFIGKELGADRFTKDGITSIPPAARWRNNLSALSQYDNLFFIASGHVVCVYQPDFPYRTLRRKPLLMIEPALANPNARGYISHGAGGDEGHCINHIIVGDLGTQEILLLATDSGNVVGYYVSAIILAVQRSFDNPNTNPTSDALGLRPFFSHWVYQSAWGLDIHKEGRTIAVSTNTPNEFQVSHPDDDYAKIVIFAFALVERDDQSDDDASKTFDDEWKIFDAQEHDGKPPKRDKSYIISLTGSSGHIFNIPNIQFVKETDRNGGIWLISTDIDGSMNMWQIWKANCVKSWDFKSNETLTRPWLHREFPGWSVAALDPRSFRYASTMEEFTSKKLPPYYGFTGRGDSYDLSSTIKNVPDNNLFHPLHEDRNDCSSTESDVMHSFIPPSSVRPHNIEPDSPIPASERPISPSIMNSINGLRSPEQPPQYTDIIEYDPDSPNIVIEAESDVEAEGIPDFVPQVPARYARRARRTATPLLYPDLAIPDFAILHCSNNHIRLLGSPRQETPHVFCQNLLRQHMPENRITTRRGFEYLHMDRLNMVHKLEDMGAVLIATQTGRVAICALTKRTDGLLSIRIDAIIPTSTQEQQSHRPMLSPLIGLAVAPVQSHPNDHSPEPFEFSNGNQDGIPITFDTDMVILSKPITPQERVLWAKQKHEPPPVQNESTSWEEVSYKLNDKSRRYLVMLTYADLTVLTYEMWRSGETAK